MAFLPSRVLPWWPHILFVILEPLALLLGAYQILTSPATFLSRLTPPSSSTTTTTSMTPPPSLSPETTILALQLSNILLLLSLTLPLILSSAFPGRSQPSLARAFLLLLALADLGHVYATYAGMGGRAAGAAFWDGRRWNGMLWGQVGGSLFLCVNRVVTAAGGFGELVGEGEGKGKRD